MAPRPMGVLESWGSDDFTNPLRKSLPSCNNRGITSNREDCVSTGATPESQQAALDAVRAYPGGLQVGGGITPDNAAAYLDEGASHVIVTSVRPRVPTFGKRFQLLV